MDTNPNSGPTTVDVVDTDAKAATVTVNSVDQVNVALDQTTAGQHVNLNDASSGNISTGGGADVVNITTASSGHGTNEHFNVSLGAGNDTLNITGNNANSTFDIHGGAGSEHINLSGSYATANIFSGGGNDVIVGGAGDTTMHFGANSGADTFTGHSTSGGWADSVMIDSHSAVTITQNSNTSWTLVVDGQTAHLTTDVAGTVNNNHIDFSAAAHGTMTMADGGTLNFDHVDHVEW